MSFVLQNIRKSRYNNLEKFVVTYDPFDTYKNQPKKVCKKFTSNTFLKLTKVKLFKFLVCMCKYVCVHCIVVITT